MRITGYILRLVDVVLIVFFGFIAISNMADTVVDLARSTEAEQAAMEAGEVVFVGVMPEGTLLIENEGLPVDSIDALRDYLNRERRRLGDEPLNVRIRGSRNATVRRVFEVAALCDELGLPKTLEVELSPSE